MDYNKTIKNYKKVDGYLLDYILESEDKYDSVRKKHTSATYKLIYNYSVNGQEYKVSTDYSTGILPEIGSAKEIFYNPNNPEEAVIVGPNRHNIMLFIGAMFAGIPLLIGASIIFTTKEKKKKSSIDLVGFILGLILIAFSYGMMYMAAGEYSIHGIWEFYVTSFAFPLLILPILIFAGAYLCAKSIFFPEGKKIRRTKRN